MKKLLAIVISMAMIVAMMPMGVFAAGVDANNCDGSCSHKVSASNGKHYDSLEDAIEDVDYGRTITILEDNMTVNYIGGAKTTAGNETYHPLTKSITIDLNGNTLTTNQTLSTSIMKENEDAEGEPTLTIKNGTLKAYNFTDGTNALINVKKGCSAVVNNATIDTKGSALYPQGNAARVTVENGSVIKAGVYAVSTNAATPENYNVIITLNNSRLTTPYGWKNVENDKYDSCPVLINTPCTLNIDKCYIEGNRQGVVVRAGTADISNSEIINNCAYNDTNNYENGNWGSGDEIPMAALLVGNTNTGYKDNAIATVTNTKIESKGAKPAIFVDDNSTYKAVLKLNGETTNVIGDITKKTSKNDASELTINGGTYSDLSALDYLDNSANVKIALSEDTDITAFKTISKGQTVTIDLAGKKITRTGEGSTVFSVKGSLKIDDSSDNATGKITTIDNENAVPVVVNGGNLELLKGSIEGKYAGVSVQGDCTAEQNESFSAGLTIKGGAITGTSTETDSFGIVVLGKDAIVNVEGGVVEAKNGYAISGNGSVTANVNYGNTVINISGGKVLSEKNYAIYHPQKGSLNITGGTVKGLGAIEIKSGEAKVGISGNPRIEATSNEPTHEKNNNGASTSGYALALVANKAYAGNANVLVSGGDIVGGIISLNDDNEQNLFPLSITGGTFSKSPKQYTAESYMVYKYSDAKYEVLAGDAEKPAGYTWTPAGEGVTDCDFIGTRIYVPSTPATPADNVTNNTADKNTTADLAPAVKDNKAETTVDAKTADKIVEKALENKSEEIIVDAAGNNTVASSEVGIPEKTVKEIAEKTDANLVIKTDNGKVDLDKTALAAVAEQAGTIGTVRLVVETVKTDENICHVNLKLITSNGAVTDFKGGNVKVTINLTKELAAKELVCVYIDDNGIYTLVEGVLNADGTYTFTTGHFSEYAVMAKAEADKKIAEQLNTLIKEVNLKVRTSKTAKKNIKAVVSGDVKAITDAGYTVKYKFYRSEKKASKYEAKATKAGKTYINTAGKKGTKYYYKAKALVYDGDKLVGQSVLTQCKYGVRTWSK